MTNLCFSLAPKYDELAALYTSNADFNSKVTIAKVDATANDVPDEIQGFPTIKLFPAGKKDKPVEYSGDRSIEDLAKFVKENGKYGVDAYKAPEAEKPVAEEAEKVGEAAKAATESVKDGAEGIKESAKSVVSGAAEAVKTAVAADDEEPAGHDEL